MALKNKAKHKSRPMCLTWQGGYVYIVSFLGYMMLYQARKPISTAKPYIKQYYEICTKLQLTFMDNAHLVPYSFTAVLFSGVIDKLGGLHSLGLSFGGAGIMVTLIFFTQYIPYPSQFLMICGLLFLGGAIQAFCWPAALKALSEYIPPRRVQQLFPIWSSCKSIGAMTGAAFMGWLYRTQERMLHERGLCEHSFGVDGCDETRRRLFTYDRCKNVTVDNALYFYKRGRDYHEHTIDWHMTFLIPGALLCFISMVILVVKPKECLVQCAPNPESEMKEFMKEMKKSEHRQTSNTQKIQENMTTWRILTEIPQVLYISLAYAGYKSARYWFFYWSPDWLVTEGRFSPSTAAYVTAWLEAGSVVGSLLPSFVMVKNKWVKRPLKKTCGVAIGCVVFVGLIFLTMIMVRKEHVVLTSICMGVLGIFMLIPEPILSGMLPLEIAEADGKNLQGAITGLVHGFGSLGALTLFPLAIWIGENDYMYSLMTISVVLVATAGLCILLELRHPE